MYIAHFLKKQLTGSPSEVSKLERKKVFSPKFASWVGKIVNKGIFHIGLVQKGVISKLISNILKKLWELHNEYLLALDKIEIKREMLSKYQIKTADLHNIPIGNIKKSVPNFFDKEKYLLHYENLQLYLKLGLKLKNI